MGDLGINERILQKWILNMVENVERIHVAKDIDQRHAWQQYIFGYFI